MVDPKNTSEKPSNASTGADQPAQPAPSPRANPTPSQAGNTQSKTGAAPPQNDGSQPPQKRLTVNVNSPVRVCGHGNVVNQPSPSLLVNNAIRTAMQTQGVAAAAASSTLNVTVNVNYGVNIVGAFNVVSETPQQQLTLKERAALLAARYGKGTKRSHTTEPDEIHEIKKRCADRR